MSGRGTAPTAAPGIMPALIARGYLLRVLTAQGKARKVAPPARVRAALIARDARAATVLDRDAARRPRVRRTVTASTRAARTAGAATARSKRAQASAARVAALRASVTL
jgi:hypothetical protein